MRAGISLYYYNSKPHDTIVEDTLDHGGQVASQNFLNDSEAGGRHYAKNYRVEVVNRHGLSSNYSCRNSSGTIITSSAYIWRVYLILPDGGRREYRNNNFVSIGSTVSDQFGRSVWIKHGSPMEDRIHAAGFGPGVQLTWAVLWKYSEASQTYETTGVSGGFGRGTTSTQTWQMEWRVVDRITLPAQAGGLSYVFGYDDNTQPAPGGWGEVNSVTTPSGAVVRYTYELEDDFRGTPSTTDVLRNNISTKTLQYQAEHDGSATNVTEQWQYSIGSAFSSIVGPDGATTSQWFGSTRVVGVHSFVWNGYSGFSGKTLTELPKAKLGP